MARCSRILEFRPRGAGGSGEIPHGPSHPMTKENIDEYLANQYPFPNPSGTSSYPSFGTTVLFELYSTDVESTNKRNPGKLQQ